MTTYRSIPALLLSAICAGLSLPPVAVPAGAAEAPTFEKLSATRQRPLFAPTRRPPPDEKSRQTADAQRPPPDVVLNAVIIGPGLRTALLMRAKETKAFPVTTGADVDGWSVSSIAPSHVVLDNKAQSVTLEFPKRANLPVPVPAGPSRRAEITR